jgi:hypothetical protein
MAHVQGLTYGGRRTEHLANMTSEPVEPRAGDDDRFETCASRFEACLIKKSPFVSRSSYHAEGLFSGEKTAQPYPLVPAYP